MQRHEIEHVLRAAAAISKENSFVLVGSQAVGLLIDSPPVELLVSAELDLYPSMHPEKADLIDGAIGALSTFHDTFGYHADGVGPETATLPPDWMERAKLVELETLLQRVAKLSVTAEAAAIISDWARRRAAEAKP